MKPLTIEELKALEVGDWVWIIDISYNFSDYFKIYYNNNKAIDLYSAETNEMYLYSTYGTKWLAYKNKEQAEGKEDEIRKKTAKEILDEVSKHYVDRWIIDLYEKYGINLIEEIDFKHSVLADCCCYIRNDKEEQ